jgi:hypothetical protein
VKYSDKLIALQLWKRGMLEKILNTKDSVDKFSGDLYWNADDTKEIRNWSEELCEQVYWTIDFHIFLSPTLIKLLSAEVCPCCVERNELDLKRRGCGECGYGKRHGVCLKDRSDYRKIRAAVAISEYRQVRFDIKLGQLFVERAGDIYKILLNKIDSGEITRENVEVWV